MNNKKIILHLCADIGSDSLVWKEEGYDVRLVGKEIGVENYTPPMGVYGVIANPVCTEFSIARSQNRHADIEKGLFLVKHCQRIIAQCSPVFSVIENPASGILKSFLGKPRFTYHPWNFGDPWNKYTALWGNFNCPSKIYTRWEDVPNKIPLYQKLKQSKPCLADLHKSAIHLIPQLAPFRDVVDCDMSFRSLCSPAFARAFYEANKCRD